MLSTIHQAYSKSPFFKLHYPFLESILSEPSTKLLDLTSPILKYLLNCFGINTPVLYQSQMQLQGKKQDLIINITHSLKGNSFLFGSQGRNYVDHSYFRQHNLMPYFHDYLCNSYPQLWGDFIPRLSAFDMLFNVDGGQLHHQLCLNNITRDHFTLSELPHS